VGADSPEAGGGWGLILQRIGGVHIFSASGGLAGAFYDENARER
jgi:hypothetical protein